MDLTINLTQDLEEDEESIEVGEHFSEEEVISLEEEVISINVVWEEAILILTVILINGEETLLGPMMNLDLEEVGV